MNLHYAMKVLGANDLAGHTLRPRYAEYYVAHQLSKNGHRPKMLGERYAKSADIYLEHTEKRIEVKSGRHEDGESYASFADGRQITDKKLDYCVFVIFDEETEGKVREVLAFSRKQLLTLTTTTRRGYGRHKNNQCLLARVTDYKDYAEWMEQNNFPIPHIEKHLNKHPAKYRKQWKTLAKNGTL